MDARVAALLAQNNELILNRKLTMAQCAVRAMDRVEAYSKDLDVPVHALLSELEWLKLGYRG